jgi:hypothetical protein
VHSEQEADIEIVSEGTLSTSAEATSETETVPFEAPERTNHIRSIEEQLQRLLGCRVEVRLASKESGTIVIPFESNAEFERILRELRRREAA